MEHSWVVMHSQQKSDYCLKVWYMQSFFFSFRLGLWKSNLDDFWPLQSGHPKLNQKWFLGSIFGAKYMKASLCSKSVVILLLNVIIQYTLWFTVIILYFLPSKGVNHWVKRSYFQKVFLVSSFRPKYQRKNLTISALEFEEWRNQQNKGTFLQNYNLHTVRTPS